jgi:hypothetical protein
MRVVAAAVAAVLLVAGSAGAEAQAEKQRPRAKRNAQGDAGGSTAEHAAPRGRNGYVEQLADKMPLGSLVWWEQMRREGRLGGETP